MGPHGIVEIVAANEPAPVRTAKRQGERYRQQQKDHVMPG
jgi:hypothetical protein